MTTEMYEQLIQEIESMPPRDYWSLYHEAKERVSDFMNVPKPRDDEEIHEDALHKWLFGGDISLDSLRLVHIELALKRWENSGKPDYFKFVIGGEFFTITKLPDGSFTVIRFIKEIGGSK